MPNDCINRFTITSSSESDIDTIFYSVLPQLHELRIIQHGKRGIRAEYTTAWKPTYTWLQALLAAYPSCWIKNEWIVEDGKAGVWIGYHKDTQRITSMEWDDLSLEADHYLFLPVESPGVIVNIK
jgi:hypothetical protein